MTDLATTCPLGRVSRHELQERIDARTPGDLIYLQGADLAGVSLKGMLLEGLVFGSHSTEPERSVAGLSATSFLECKLVKCQFAHVECVNTYFRGARIVDCDFRYAAFTGGSFAEAHLVDCDFYRAAFDRGWSSRKP